MTVSRFATLRPKLKLTQGQATVGLRIEREPLRELKSGPNCPVYQLNRLALEQVGWLMVVANNDVVTGNVLECAQRIFESVGYDIVAKSSR